MERDSPVRRTWRLLFATKGAPQNRAVPLKRIIDHHGYVCYDMLAHRAISLLFPDMPPEAFEVTMTYIDADGDCITISTTEELEDVISQCPQQEGRGVLRLKTVLRRRSTPNDPTSTVLGKSPRQEADQNVGNTTNEVMANHVAIAVFESDSTRFSETEENKEMQVDSQTEASTITLADQHAEKSSIPFVSLLLSPSKLESQPSLICQATGQTSYDLRNSPHMNSSSATTEGKHVSTIRLENQLLESGETELKQEISFDGLTEPSTKDSLDDDADYERSIPDASLLYPIQQESQPSSIPQATGQTPDVSGDSQQQGAYQKSVSTTSRVMANDAAARFENEVVESDESQQNEEISVDGRSEPSTTNSVGDNAEERCVTGASLLQSPSQDESQPSLIHQATGQTSNVDLDYSPLQVAHLNTGSATSVKMNNHVVRFKNELIEKSDENEEGEKILDWLTEASITKSLDHDAEERPVPNACLVQAPDRNVSQPGSIPPAVDSPSNGNDSSSSADVETTEKSTETASPTSEGNSNSKFPNYDCFQQTLWVGASKSPEDTSATAGPRAKDSGEVVCPNDSSIGSPQPTVDIKARAKATGNLLAHAKSEDFGEKCQNDSSTGFGQVNVPNKEDKGGTVRPTNSLAGSEGVTVAFKARNTPPVNAAKPAAQPRSSRVNNQTSRDPRYNGNARRVGVKTVCDSSASDSDDEKPTREQALSLLDSDDLDDFESDASQLRNACFSRNAEPAALNCMLEICRSNQEKIKVAMKVAAEFDQYLSWGKLSTMHSIVSDALAVAEREIGDTMDPAEARPLKRSVESMVAEKDIVSLVWMLRAHDERRFDAAVALMKFARVGTSSQKAIRTHGGDRLLLRLFRTYGIPKDLRVVVALAFVYVLPRFPVSLSSVSPLFALKIVECLQFLFSAEPVRSRAAHIEREEMRHAATEGMETFWAYTLLPLINGKPTVRNSADGHVGTPHDIPGSCLDPCLEYWQTEELLTKAVSLVIRIVKCKSLRAESNIGTLVAQICALEEARPIAVHKGVLNVLLDWITSNDYDLVKVAAFALRDLASMQDQSLASRIHAQMITKGTLETLARLTLSNALDRSVNMAVAETLSTFCEKTSLREAVLTAHCVPCLVSLLDLEDPSSVEVAYHAGKALTNLASDAVKQMSVTKYNDLLDEIVQLGAIGTFIIMADLKLGWKHCVMAVQALRVMSEDTNQMRETRRRLCEDGAVKALGHVIAEVAVHLNMSPELKASPEPVAETAFSDSDLLGCLDEALMALANILVSIRAGRCVSPSSGNSLRHQLLDGHSETALQLDTFFPYVSQVQPNKRKTALEAAERFYEVHENHGTADSMCHEPDSCDVLSHHEPSKSSEENLMIAMFSAPLVHHNQGEYWPIAQPKFDIERELLWSLKVTNPDLTLEFETATVDRLLAAISKKCSLLHYHGLHDHGFGRGDLLSFEINYGEADWKDKKQVQSFIAKDGVAPFNFVFVTSCHPVVAGEAFIQAGVPHVVCCQQDSDLQSEVAHVFTRRFYIALAEGQSVKYSFEQGCEAVLSRFRDVDLSRFSLLPLHGNHDVRVLSPSSVPCEPQSSNFTTERPLRTNSRRCDRIELKMRNIIQQDPSPVPPCYFLGREVEIFKILRGIMDKRIVSVVGEAGVGRSSVVRALCHYINERRSTVATTIEHIYFVQPKQVLPSVRSHELILLLWEKVVMAGNNCRLVTFRDLPQAICKCLYNQKALVVFDHTELLDGSGEVKEFVDFISVMKRGTKHVKILLTGCIALGEPAIGEQRIEVEPLDFGPSVRLFACLCPHLRTEEVRRNFCDRMGSDRGEAVRRSCDPAEHERVRKILGALSDGYPALIEKEAQKIKSIKELENLKLTLT